jgi:uncharacterized protein with PIN domain
MNKEIMIQAGFAKEVERVEQHKCPFCNTPVIGVRKEFKDAQSFKEFQISGLCQKCQDEIFG